MSDTEILDWIEANREKYEIQYVNWLGRRAWRIYDGPVGRESTECIGAGNTLRGAVEKATTCPYAR